MGERSYKSSGKKDPCGAAWKLGKYKGMRKFLFLFLLLLSALGGWSKTAVIFHTSDAHGFFYPDHSGMGGYAALASLLNKEDKDYLLLDSGDFSNGSQEATFSKGLYSAELLNRLAYDAVTLGNHEYYFGKEALNEMLTHLKVPVLAANLKDANGQMPAGLLPYKMFDKDGVKIAVIGLASNEIRGGVHVAQDCLKSLEETLFRIYGPVICIHEDLLGKSICRQVQGHFRPDIVVVLAHHSLLGGSAYGKQCLAQIPQRFGKKVHLVLGGHAHHQFELQTRGNVSYSESGHGLKGVSRIELDIDDKSGQLRSVKSRYIMLNTRKIGEREDIKDFLSGIRLAHLDETIGRARQALTFQMKKGEKDSALGNWAADLIAQYAQSDVAVNNNGSLRKEIKKGPVSLRDMTELYPYQNKIFKFRVSGELIQKMLHRDLKRPVPSFSYSGLKAVCEKNEKGEITQEKIWIQGQPLQADKIYTLATIEYLAFTKGEGGFFAEIADHEKILAGEKDLAQRMQESFAQGALAPHTGRLRVKQR